MHTTDNNESKIVLSDQINEIISVYEEELEVSKLQSLGHKSDSIIRSTEASETKARDKTKQEIGYFIEEEENNIIIENTLLELSEEERVGYALLQMNNAKTKELSNVTSITLERLIPLKNQAKTHGRAAVMQQDNARLHSKEIKQLKKDAKWNITHIDAIYYLALFLLGIGDAIALKMTLTAAGAGSNAMIDGFLPGFAFVMAGLAHFLSKSILENKKMHIIILGTLSGTILLVLFALRIAYFELN